MFKKKIKEADNKRSYKLIRKIGQIDGKNTNEIHIVNIIFWPKTDRAQSHFLSDMHKKADR